MPAVLIVLRWGSAHAKKRPLLISINGDDFCSIAHLGSAAFFLPPGNQFSIKISMDGHYSPAFLLMAQSQKLIKLRANHPEGHEMIGRSFNKETFFDLFPEESLDLSLPQMIDILTSAGGYDGNVRKFDYEKI